MNINHCSFWKHNNNYAKIWLAWNKLKTYKFKAVAVALWKFEKGKKF